MIKRIVKLTFLEGQESAFLEIYDQVQMDIRKVEGCKGLELVRDRENPSIFFTLSLWTSEDVLNEYRSSELFIGTWRRVRAILAHRAEVWSTDIIAQINE